MGLNVNVNTVLEKVTQVATWRKEHHMDRVREQLLEQVRDSTQSVIFPHAEVKSKLCKFVTMAPCSLVTPDGWPVSVWHVGTANAKLAPSLSEEHLVAWSCAVNEYADMWVSALSEQTGRLGGHIQVFNLEGVGFWQATNSQITSRLKTLFGAGGMYVELLTHIYIINSGTVFNAIWKLVKGLITPRTASKITVAGGMPDELLAELGP